jgi:hypothetical protein
VWLHYFLIGDPGAGAAGLAVAVPSTGSTLMSSTSNIKAEFPGILF